MVADIAEFDRNDKTFSFRHELNRIFQCCMPLLILRVANCI